MKRLIRWLLLIVGAALVGLALSVPKGMWGRIRAAPFSPASWILFQPTPLDQEAWLPPGFPGKEVHFFAEDGTALDGLWLTPEEPQAVVLYSHGNAGNLADRIPYAEELMTEQRVAVLLYDYRGYGHSEGTPSVEGILMDARAARREAARLGDVAAGDLVLMGRSLGGAVAVALAKEQTPRALILQSTFTSLHAIASFHFSWLAFLVGEEELDSLQAITRIDCPLLLSHGDADGIIPFAQGQQLFAAAPGRKTFFTVAGGQHNSNQGSAYRKVLARFLSELPALSAGR